MASAFLLAMLEPLSIRSGRNVPVEELQEIERLVLYKKSRNVQYTNLVLAL